MQKKQSFVTGAAVLAAASVLCKIMSAVFKIPLDRFFLHEEGIAVYQSACSIYNVFLAICVTGIPIALSSLIARSDDNEAVDLCFSTFVTVTVFCAVSALFLYVFSGSIARHLSGGNIAPARNAIRVSAPALIVMGVISSVRGYFQGRGSMVPSALSQLCESFMKAVLGIVLCALFIGGGMANGSAGAMAGVTAGALSAGLVLLIFYKKQHLPRGSYSFSKAAEVIKLSVPVTLGAFGFTAVLLADTLTVTNILADCGIAAQERLKLFGYLSRANTVYNLPATIITAVTASIVPVISSARKNGEKAALSEQTLRAIKLIFLVAAPCALGLMFFAPQIFLLLYSSGIHAELLVFTGILVLIMPYFQTTTGILQALGCVWKPIFACGGAVVLKIILNFVLIPAMGISGAPAATAAAFFIAALINSVFLKSAIDFGKNTFILILKLLICASVSCAAARVLYMLRPTTVVLLASILFAAAAYFVLIWITGCISPEDVSQLRKENA